METARRNSKRETHGRRYDIDLKYFATYLFIVAGRSVYEFLYANMKGALISLSQVDRMLSSTSTAVKEGFFRFDDLDVFLTDHNLPRKVFISEDGTRIVQRFSYDLSSDQIIGPCPPLARNGVPIINSFPASSAAMIACHFEKGEPSSSAYAMMAQPVQHGAPSFCLAVFGTNNKFTAEQVYLRWKYIYEELERRGIEVIGFASDGDPKLLSAMHSHMFRGDSRFEEMKDLYFASSELKFTVMQDFIHTVNKFRTRLNPANLLPLGKYSASQSHLRILIQEHSKEEHGLVTSDLDKADKMNFSSSVKICSERVTDLLKLHVPGSEGTVAYLTVMRFVMEAGLDEGLSPIEIIYKVWYAVSFFRYWKHWLTITQRFTLDNFVSRNLYMCVEIIAHSIVNLVIKFRNEGCPENFLIYLFGSQQSESFFRHLRSMTTTESTVINFSMKEILQKVKRIDVLHNVSSKLAGKVDFPREKRKRLLGSLAAEKLKLTYMPSNVEIKACILEAMTEAASDLQKLGVECPQCPSKLGNFVKTSLLSCKNFEPDENLTFSHLYEASVDEEDIPLDLLASFPSPDSVTDLNPHADVPCHADVLPTKTSHVLVPDGRKGFKSMSKSLFCWILSSVGGTTLDNVRIHRVRESILTSLGSSRKHSNAVISREQEISIGNWCVFKDEKTIVLSQIIGFCYLSGKSKSYTLLKAPVNPPEGKIARGIGCLGIWYNINGTKLDLCATQNKYLDIKMYSTTVPAPKFSSETGSLELSAEISDYLSKL